MDYSDLTNLGLLVLRLLAGLVLASHGVAKLRSLDGTAGWFASEGLKPGRLHAWLAGLTETLAGLGIAAGLLTPLSAAAFIGVMVTAGWVGHRKNGFSSARNGWEQVFVLGSLAALVALFGPGEWSLDAAFGIADALGYAAFTDAGGLWWAIGAVAFGAATSVATLGAFYRPPTAQQTADEQS